MSPVSRGRRGRKAKHAKTNATGRPSPERGGVGGSSAGERPSAWAVLESLAGPRERPEWFDSSIEGVLEPMRVQPKRQDSYQQEYVGSVDTSARPSKAPRTFELYGHSVRYFSR